MCFWKPFYFVLGYNQLTVLWWFQVNSKVQSVFLKMVISQSVFFKEGSSGNKLIANSGFSLLMTLTDFNSLSLHLYVCFIVGRGRGKHWRSLRWNVGCSFFHEKYGHFLICPQLLRVGGLLERSLGRRPYAKCFACFSGMNSHIWSFPSRDLQPLHYLSLLGESLSDHLLFRFFNLTFTISETDLCSITNPQ